MRRGQGLAGQVFSTGVPGRVANYLTDRSISQDFMSLAATEQTLSALAAPMRTHGELIGVLEVWRRRPSVFADDDTLRLEALANLATIAIDNARLHSAHERSVADLHSAHRELAAKLTMLGRSAAVQRSLLDTVLTGIGHAGIVAALFEELRWPAVVLGPGGQPVACCPQAVDTGPLQDMLRRHGARPAEHSFPAAGDAPPRIARAHPIVLDGEVRGHVCLIADAGDTDLLESALSQAAMACCLVELQQQTASRARAQACDEVLWDLLDGPVEQRMAARSRAASLGVRLPRSMRVVHAALDNVAEMARLPEQDSESLDRVRRQVLRCVREHAPPAQLSLAAQRGDWIIGVSGLAGTGEIRILLESLSAAVAERWPDLRLRWAASGAGHDALGLPQALNEARAAMGAARRLALTGPCLYDELGVVRLLVGGHEDPDLKKFVGAITQPLLDYDTSHDGALVDTLRVFFQADCSQRVAAERLFIHHKTLRYRLEQIRALTGLDLSTHADRVRADLALQLLEVTRTAG
jgi:sugar diacid utilization regulator